MGEYSECKGDKEKDSDSNWLILEDLLKSINAVVGRGSSVNRLEVVEKAWIADTVAGQTAFHICSKCTETFRESRHRSG